MFHRFAFPAVPPDACCKMDAVPAETANLAVLLLLQCVALGLRTAALLTGSTSTLCRGKEISKDFFA